MNSEAHADKRKDPRYPMVLRVSYSDGASYVSAWTENISAGGLFIQTEKLVPEGERVTMELSFPGLMKPVTVHGYVAWSRPAGTAGAAGIGVRAVADVDRRALAELAAMAGEVEDESPVRVFQIMIVEDNPLAARSYERALRRFGTTKRTQMNVLVAENGHVALEQLAGTPVDSVISDLYMPVMDGFQLLRRIREQEATREVPVLIATSGPEEELALAKLAGATALIRKPFQMGHLLETIACLLRKPAAHVQGPVRLGTKDPVEPGP